MPRSPSPAERAALVEGLRATAVPDELVADLVDAAQVHAVRPGDPLLEQGDRGRALLVVIEGVVEVRHDGQLVAHLMPGEVAGEVGAALDLPRTGAVAAVTRGRVAVLPDRAVRRVLRRAPAAAEELRDVASARRIPVRDWSHTATRP